MITGFKKRFEPFVVDGSKQHTLRDIRKGDRQIRVGDRLDLYANVRQKNQRLLGRWWCVRVQVARFSMLGGMYEMSIDGVLLSRDEANGFAWRDGFRHKPSSERTGALYSSNVEGCFMLMMDYWREQGAVFPFTKQLLHWKFSDRLPDDLATGGSNPKKPKRRANG